MNTFPNLTSLKSGMRTNNVKFLDNDPTLPYVKKDSQWYYFAQNLLSFYNDAKEPIHNPTFVLVMISSKDLMREKS